MHYIVKFNGQRVNSIDSNPCGDVFTSCSLGVTPVDFGPDADFGGDVLACAGRLGCGPVDFGPDTDVKGDVPACAGRLGGGPVDIGSAADFGGDVFTRWLSWSWPSTLWRGD